MEDTKKMFNDLLLSTNREGVPELIEYLEEIGFYSAPASTRFHGAYDGALLEHSLNVGVYAEKMGVAWLGKKEYKKIQDSVVIAALLHDVGKAGQFGKPLYIPNELKSGTSKTKPYKYNDDLLTLPHEIVSCIEVTKFIDLTEEEQNAIAWHNGLYGAFKYDIQGKESVLYMLIHFADMWASRVIEEVTREGE